MYVPAYTVFVVAPRPCCMEYIIRYEATRTCLLVRGPPCCIHGPAWTEYMGQLRLNNMGQYPSLAISTQECTGLLATLHRLGPNQSSHRVRRHEASHSTTESAGVKRLRWGVNPRAVCFSKSKRPWGQSKQAIQSPFKLQRS